MTDATEPRPALCLEMAHVLFTDIVAYSTIYMDRQHQSLHDLQDAVRGTPTFTRAQADDQLIRLPTGDGMALVFFHDPEAPVRCALELAKNLRKYPEIKLRMGIHTGPVYRVADINANRNVAGGGINIAQRVMDCGDAGHILVSSAHAEVLGQVSAWSPMLHDLGEVEVKHGVRLHLHNLYTAEAGNSESPKKVSTQRAAESLAGSGAKKRKRSMALISSAIILAVVSGGAWRFYAHKTHALNATDTIVLADFTNTTGDPVFDGTLRRGLSIQLEQSPFLSIISDDQIHQTLGLMGRPAEGRLTSAIARELCQRTSSAAVIDGSITQIGTPYLLTLKAFNCSNGESLASTEAQASDKSHVLDALGKTASEIRDKLGESLSTVEKFDTSLEQATTPSLEALKAFSSGFQIHITAGDAAAIPFYKHAIELDPNFALAYVWLGLSFNNLGELNMDVYHTQKAYDMCDRASDPEKYFITARFHKVVTGNMEKAEQALQLWIQAYPRAALPHTYLAGAIYPVTGQYEKAVEAGMEAIRLSPDSSPSYLLPALDYIALNRLDEAKATYQKAVERKLKSGSFSLFLYQIAFLQNDAAQMAQQVSSSAGKPGIEGTLLANEADTAAYYGRLRKARELSGRAMDSAERAKEEEAAATYSALSGLREALFGNAAEARRRAALPMEHSAGHDVEYGSALALAYAGADEQAKKLTDDLGRRFPEATIVQFNYLPALRAKLAIRRGNASEALETLRAATPYELGQTKYSSYDWTGLYPVYVRGEAYLAAHQGSEAATEFQKILDHRGIVLNEPIGALAHLGLARAYVLQGDTAKARAAYNDFLTLWKDADSDIPILKQAKAEYAKLQ